MNKYYLGIDLGTSSAKMILLNDEGVIVKTIVKKYPIYFPKEGWSEQDPLDWLIKVKEGIKEISDFLGHESKNIQSICIDGQMHGLVALDENDKVIRPAILWNDGRTTNEVEYLNEVIGKKKLVEYTGNIAFAGFTAPKILWVKNNEPKLFEKIKKVMLPKDYVNYMLTKEFSTDYSDGAGTLLLDVKNKKWSKEMLDICGLKEEQLPKLYNSFEVVGTVTREAAEELKISENCKVLAGASDNAAAAIGTGVVGENQCMVSLGTSGTLLVSGNFTKIEEPYGIHSFAHADGNYHVLGCMLSAASCAGWWNSTILKNSDFKDINENEANYGNKLYFLPYLMGERSPHNNPKAKSAFIGMNFSTTDDDMTMAILEGVAFGIRDSLEIVRNTGKVINSIKLCGGGSKNKLWQIIMANALNAKILLMDSEEGAALGAAIIATVGAGKFNNLKEATDSIINVNNTISPKRELVKIYDEKYKVFKELYKALEPIFNTW